MEAELERTDAYYRSSALRQAQLTYFGGMAVVAALVILATASLALGRGHLLQRPLTVAALAGAAGALVSVLSRMSRGRLELHREMRATASGVLGSGRLVLGAMLGGAVYVLFTGGLVPMPEHAHRGLAFYAGAAFLAGFTERLVADAAGATSATRPRE